MKYRCVASFIKIEVLNCEPEILRRIDAIFGMSAQLKKPSELASRGLLKCLFQALIFGSSSFAGENCWGGTTSVSTTGTLKPHENFGVSKS